MNFDFTNVIAVCGSIIALCGLLYSYMTLKHKADSEAVRLNKVATDARLGLLEKRSDECEKRELIHLADIRTLTHEVRALTNEKMDLMMKLIYRGDQSEHTAALVADTESRKHTSNG